MLQWKSINDSERIISYNIFNTCFFLNQQFITWCMRTDCGSYFVATYKRNRLTGGLNLKGKEEKKKRKIKRN